MIRAASTPQDGAAAGARAFFTHAGPVRRREDSALAQTAILQGEEFPSVPNYYAVGGIEILGQLREGRVYGINTRPAPQAQVYELSDAEVRGLLAISGDVLVGSLDGYESVQVYLDSQSKSVFPRNVGIFGTVGSGKSNTAQVVIVQEIRKILRCTCRTRNRK